MADETTIQTHPLYASDRELVNRLLAVESPSDADLVEAARLGLRYRGFPGAYDLQEDLIKVQRFWGLSGDDLHRRTRAIWSAGYRPGAAVDEQAVGSGFDTADGETV